MRETIFEEYGVDVERLAEGFLRYAFVEEPEEFCKARRGDLGLLFGGTLYATPQHFYNLPNFRDGYVKNKNGLSLTRVYLSPLVAGMPVRLG